MDIYQTPYIYYCLSNFLFVVTCMFCAIIRWFHVCHEYREQHQFYFPARKIVACMFAVQLLQSVYWLNVYSEEAFFFVSLFGVLIIPPFFVFIERRYFFFFPFKKKELLGHFALPALILSSFIYGIYHSNLFFAHYRVKYQILATLLFIIEFYWLVKGQIHIWNILRHRFEMEYADSSHFPTLFANRKLGMTVCWSLVLLFVLWANSRWIKLGVDLFLSMIAVHFLITILDTHREADPPVSADPNTDNADTVERKNVYLSESQRLELEERIVDLLVKEELFKQSDLSLNALVKSIGYNRSYISETIGLSSYGSFYKMVNYFRLEYAKCRLVNDPDIKIEQLAFDAGFSSRYMLTRAFKEFYGMTPTEWKKKK